MTPIKPAAAPMERILRREEMLLSSTRIGIPLVCANENVFAMWQFQLLRRDRTIAFLAHRRWSILWRAAPSSIWLVSHFQNHLSAVRDGRMRKPSSVEGLAVQPC